MSLKTESEIKREEDESDKQIEYYRLLWHETDTHIFYINSGGFFEVCDRRQLKLDNYEDNITRVSAWVNKSQYISRIDGQVTSVKKAVIERFIRTGISNTKNYAINLDGNLTNCAIDNLYLVTKDDNDAYLKGKPIYSFLKNEKRVIFHNILEFITALGLSSEAELRAYYSRFKRYASTGRNKWLDKYKITMLELEVENLIKDE